MTHELLDDYMADMLAAPASVPSVVPSAPVATAPPPEAVPSQVRPVQGPPTLTTVPSASSDASAPAEPSAPPAPDVSMADELMAEFDAEMARSAKPAVPAPAPPPPSLMDDLLAEFDAEVNKSAPVATPAAAAPALSLVDDLMAEFDAEVARAAPAAAPTAAPATAPISLVGVPATVPASIHGLKPEPREKRRRAEEIIKRWLRFTVGEQSYAVEVLKVQEVMRVPEVLSLRGAEPALLGVMNLRGLIVPVIDLGLRLAAPPVQITPLTRVVVLESDGEALGLLVSTVAEVMAIAESHIEHPGNLQCGSSCDSLTGVCRQGGTLTVLLDAVRLLQ